MSGWWVVPSNSIVCVDDAALTVDCSDIAANIYMMRWWGTDGEILYNHSDRLPVREPFVDISPYIPAFNRWIVASENPSIVARTAKTSPPITVTQAKAVKSKMVDALFASKRQSPISAFGYVWDASDNATGAMTDEIAALSGTDAINSAVGALAASVNQAFSDIATDTHDAIQGLASSVNTVNTNYAASNTGARSADAQSLNASLSTQQQGHTANITIANGNFSALSFLNIPSTPAQLPVLNPQGGIGAPSMPTTDVAPTPASAPPVTAPTVAATPASGPPINWPTLSGQLVTLQYTQFTSILQSITTRRNSLQQTRTTHKNNIVGLTTVPAVAAYDITAGW
jgi:hypothetical protein